LLAAAWHDLSWSRYQPQMVRSPWFWSMQLLKLVTSCAQTPGAWYWEFMVVWPFSFWARGWSAGAAAALEPPPNQPPTAWPMEEPTATPLWEERC
jgi:hypothetical protein